jgi:hypothetical protein
MEEGRERPRTIYLNRSDCTLIPFAWAQKGAALRQTREGTGEGTAPVSPVKLKEENTPGLPVKLGISDPDTLTVGLEGRSPSKNEGRDQGENGPGKPTLTKEIYTPILTFWFISFIYIRGILRITRGERAAGLMVQGISSNNDPNRLEGLNAVDRVQLGAAKKYATSPSGDGANISAEAKALLERDQQLMPFLRQMPPEASSTDKVTFFKQLRETGNIQQYLDSLSGNTLADSLLNSPAYGFLKTAL